MNIGAALKRVRFEKGLMQGDVAAKAKISQTYLSQLENGGKPNPSKLLIDRLCKVYEIPPVFLIWMATEEKDVKANKRHLLEKIKQPMDALILEFIKK